MFSQNCISLLDIIFDFSRFKIKNIGVKLRIAKRIYDSTAKRVVALVKTGKI